MDPSIFHAHSSLKHIKSGHFYKRKRFKVRSHPVSKNLSYMLLTILLVCTHINSSQDQYTPLKSYDKGQSYHLWKVTISMHSLWLHSLMNTKRPLSFETSKYYWILILGLSNDIETNPGPVNQILYQLGHPCLCGFYRSTICNVLMGIKLLPQENSMADTFVELEQGINDMNSIFDGHFLMSELDFDKILKHSKRIVNTVNTWKRNSGRVNMETYFDTFSAANWLKLDENIKNKHTPSCSECESAYLVVHATFPCKSKLFSKEKKRLDNLVIFHNKENITGIVEQVKPSLKRILSQSLSALQEGKPNKIRKTSLQNLSLQLGNVFDECFKEHSNNNPTFLESYAKGNQLAPKMSSREVSKLKWQTKKNVLAKMKAFNDENCDIRLYAGDSSLRSWDRDRSRKSKITVQEAEARAKREAEKVRLGLKKPKDHIGNLDNYRVDKVGIIKAVSSWTDEHQVNWTQDLGNKFIQKLNEDKAPDNSGQIAKEFVLAEEKAGRISLKYLDKGKAPRKIIRRSYKKVDHNLSVPVDMHSSKIKLIKDAKVESKEIDIGLSIVERTYEKVSINEFGDIVRKSFSVSGRKYPLLVIRENIFHQYHKYMRLNSDAYFDNLDIFELSSRLKQIGEFYEDETVENMQAKLKVFERTRNFQLWHDGSSIANHGHILFCVNVLYDQAVFLTSEEFHDKFGYNVDIQRKVETPQLYIIGRCRNNDEQLGYIDTRLSCLKELKTSLNVKMLNNNYDNFELTDVLRIFHADGCAMSFETGNVGHGGHYFCPSCDIHRCQADDISSSYNRLIRSLSYRQNEMMKGKFGKLNSLKKKTLPLNKLTAEQMEQELLSRNVDIKNIKKNLTELGSVLKKTLKGIRRVPIILMHTPSKSLSEIGLPNYEFSMVEPMHDIANHIEHVLEEIPHHLKEPHKTSYNNIFSPIKEEKQMKRCCDWRRMLLYVTHHLYKISFPGKVIEILKTLSEIQRILYLKDEQRTAMEILRLHNTCFQHFVLLKSFFDIGNLSAGMTPFKLYGKYAHNLLVHAPIQYRLISGESLNVEAEERMFKTKKDLTHNKTNFRPGHMIDNILTRGQYSKIDKKLKCQKDNKRPTTILPLKI